MLKRIKWDTLIKKVIKIINNREKLSQKMVENKKKLQ